MHLVLQSHIRLKALQMELLDFVVPSASMTFVDTPPTCQATIYIAQNLRIVDCHGFGMTSNINRSKRLAFIYFYSTYEQIKKVYVNR